MKLGHKERLFSDQNIRAIRAMMREGYSDNWLAIHLGVSRSTIYQIRHGWIYKDVPEDEVVKV